MNKSNNWDKDEKDNWNRYNQYNPYPRAPLPKVAKIVITGFAILLTIGIINSFLNPGPPIFPTAEQIEAMSCLELQEFIEKNIDYEITGMSYWVKEATHEFLNECSSYGGLM